MTPDDVTLHMMDGIDADPDVDFPDSDSDFEMSIDSEPTDAEGNPERAGHQHPPSSDHEVGEVSAVSTQTSLAPVRESFGDPSPGAESPTNSKNCLVNSILCVLYMWCLICLEVCKVRPVQENSSLPTCGPACTLDLDKMQLRGNPLGSPYIDRGHTSESNGCWVSLSLGMLHIW